MLCGYSAAYDDSGSLHDPLFATIAPESKLSLIVSITVSSVTSLDNLLISGSNLSGYTPSGSLNPVLVSAASLGIPGAEAKYLGCIGFPFSKNTNTCDPCNGTVHAPCPDIEPSNKLNTL